MIGKRLPTALAHLIRTFCYSFQVWPSKLVVRRDNLQELYSWVFAYKSAVVVTSSQLKTRSVGDGGARSQGLHTWGNGWGSS